MDRLDQLFARSLREIEAHSTELRPRRAATSSTKPLSSWPRYACEHKANTAPRGQTQHLDLAAATASNPPDTVPADLPDDVPDEEPCECRERCHGS
jgi:hypothetical protein